MIALGMNSQAWVDPCWISSEKGGIGASQILGDFLELVDRAPLLARQGPDDILQTMIEMILDQGLLGLADRLLHRVELLGDIETRPTTLDHLDDAVQMPCGAPQPLDDVGMGFVEGRFVVHIKYY